LIDIIQLITKARDALIPHRRAWSKDVIVRHAQDYDEYLQSDHWQATRYRQLKAAGFKCSECGDDNQVLHVHHLNYDHLGHERDKDLAILCESCHRSKHGIDK
jgi:5-methylcytosine-specific restriction endonuclease McrA